MVLENKVKKIIVDQLGVTEEAQIPSIWLRWLWHLKRNSTSRSRTKMLKR